MSHRIKKRSIFAFLDGRMSESQEKRFKDHVSGCYLCRAYLSNIEALMRAAREAAGVTEPEWTRIDRSVERAIREISAERRTGAGWAPAALTLAAAAAVALAIMLPSLPQERPLELKGMDEVALQAKRVPAAASPEFIVATIADTLLPDAPWRVGQAIETGFEVATGDCGGVRVALDSDALLEAGPDTIMELASLDPQSPAVEILGGRLVVAVKRPSFGYERGLAVLAGGSGFNVLSGIVEFIYNGDTLTVKLMEGEVVADESLGGAALTPGVWTARRQEDSPEWLAIEGLKEMRVSELSALSPGDEQSPSGARIGGTLPLHMVRDSLSTATPKIRDCYETALKRDPNLTLTSDVSIEVGPLGSVTSAKARGLEGVPQLKKCIERVVKDVRFPKPQGGSVEIVLPLRLYPEN